ncbi:hypothetical protein SAMN04487911_1257 [Arenibacter nanhaiticus]|uniref:Uncharacterized protein n=1 Tax=Arenibacter nanhaiticus TaxID=558155 RepID=A0A1M6KAD5_9FLAO|nr:hypothetical protein [Arenibacter nanhaiticus]SHJ55941.1 hypothetical protein SAMN04487911_1257 [Arenibacter nanhaiticus]
MKYTDANGEFFWFAVIAGAVIGAVAQAVKPGTNFGTIVGGGLIGAVAGMVGAGGGFFSSGMSASMGFWGGAASGSAGGFAGGFVGSTGTSWMNGANFGEGLGSGLTAGVIGGVTGGLANGISSGFKANKAGLDFFNGKERAIVQPNNTINSGAVVSNSRPIPRVYAEGDYLDWTGTVAGPDGGSVFRTGTANVEYTFRVSDTSIDWGTTLRVNGSEIEIMLQNVGDGMAVAGYGLTLTGAGAGFGVPIAGIGSGVSFSGSILESAANANWSKGGITIGAFGVDLGTDILIKRIPGSTLSTQILLQNKSLKINLIEKFINN